MQIRTVIEGASWGKKMEWSLNDDKCFSKISKPAAEPLLNL